MRRETRQMEKYEQLSRADLEAELNKSREILQMLSHTVLGGFAKMSLDGMRIRNASEGYYRLTGYTEEESHLPPFSDCGVNLVLPEDIPRVNEAIEALVRDNRATSIDYRFRKKDGSIAWNTAYCSGVERDEQGAYLEVFYLDSTEAKNTELQLKSLLNNLTSGLVRLRVDAGFSILYANDEFFRQIGYTQDEFAADPLRNDYQNLIHPDDRAHLRQQYLTFIGSDQPCPAIDYRIVTKGGETRWIRAHTARLYEELQGENLLQCILTDVTMEKEQARQNRLYEERYRIIAEQTRDVVFDWDITDDSIHYSPVFEKMFGFPPPSSISTDEILASDLFYEEDKPVIVKLIADMRAARPFVECRARMKGRDGAYFWTLHRATTIYDEDRKSLLIVGIVTDVNDFMKSNLDLQHKAAHDPLTGLLNRSAAQGLVEQRLEQKPDGSFVFVQFDIDHFKQINDFMGHAAGDFALQKIALQMREMFRAEDLLVRMGGDEFAIFLESPASGDGALSKIRQFLQTVHCDFKFEEKIYPLSISAGAAVYPQNGHTFQELYEHADEALYQAKRAGGNRLALFSPRRKPGRP